MSVLKKKNLSISESLDRYIEPDSSKDSKKGLIYTKEQIEEIQKLSDIVRAHFATIGPMNDGLANLSSSLLPILHQSNQVFSQVINTMTVTVSKRMMSEFLVGLRATHDFIIDTSFIFKNFAEDLADALKGVSRVADLIGDILQANANSLKSIINFIEDDSLSKLSRSFIIPKIEFPIFPLNPDDQPAPSSVNNDTSQSIFTQDVPLAFHEQRLTFNKNPDGSMVYVSSRKPINNLSELNAAYSQITNQQLALSSSSIRRTPDIWIENCADQKAFICIEGMTPSHSVSMDPAWFKVLKAYIENLKILRKKDIIGVWNQANKNKFRNKKRKKNDQNYIPKIHQQIKTRVQKHYGSQVCPINFKLIKIGTFKGRYELIILPQEVQSNIN